MQGKEVRRENQIWHIKSKATIKILKMTWVLCHAQYSIKCWYLDNGYMTWNEIQYILLINKFVNKICSFMMKRN